jgi:3-phenylpropionate/trans-cinnamate dioxygenase ferredoxin reductase component
MRDAGFDGEIVLIGAESVPPYERPYLSKDYLWGTVGEDRLGLRPITQYRDLGVELLPGEPVAELGIEGQAVSLVSGRKIHWDRLCVATGSAARQLAGFEDGIYLRELPQARRLRTSLERREELSVVGAGFIGCEVAAAGVRRGCEVHVYEALEQPQVRVLGSDLGAFLAGVHRGHGVDLHMNVGSLPAMPPPVVVGVGSVPRVELAHAARLAIDGGIVVDEFGRTSAPDVFAAGDVTKFFSPLFETHIRVEHFQTSQRQGFAVGRAMAGAIEPYFEAPWFWSDQYELNIQYVGAPLEFDEQVTRGEIGKPPFTVFRLNGGRLMTVIGFNDHHTVARARRVMETRAEVTARQLADPSLDLRTLLKPA